MGYPNAPYSPGSLTDGVDYPQAAHINDLRTEVTAIETALLSGITHPITSSTSLAVAELSVSGGSTFAGTLAAASTAVNLGSSSALFGTAYLSGLQVGGTSITTNGQMTLLKANSGTSTAAGATDVDTIAIAGLTAKDTLIVYVNCKEVTQDVANVRLYNTTDNLRLCDVSSTPLASGQSSLMTATVRQQQAGATTVIALGQGYGGGAAVTDINTITFTTNWTGAWTLGFRHGGVTAGGTLQWSWSVFKVAGQ